MSTAIRRKKRFTLIELLVSMGVFIIIVGLLLQFFTGARRMWTHMEQRNNIYADARVTMEIMSTLLQNAFYTDGGVPFVITMSKSGTGANEFGDDGYDSRKYKIYFATQTLQNLPGGKLKYVTFQLGNGSTDSGGTGEKHQLKLGVFSSEDENFEAYFPPYGLGAIQTFEDASSGVVSKLNDSLKNNTTGEKYSSVIASHITSFQIIPYLRDTGSSSYGLRVPSSADEPADVFTGDVSSGFTFKQMPFLIELKLTMLSPEDFNIWRQLSPTERDDFRKEREYTFTRAVYIGDQWRTNIE